MSETKKQKIDVTINKRTYTVISHESKSHIEHIAQLVDQKMTTIRESNPSLDSKQAAVLTALNTMDDYTKLQNEYEILLQLIEEEKK